MTPIEPRLAAGILADRLQRLIRLDTSVFDEASQDPGATLPSVIILVVSTLFAGVGGWLWWIVQDFPDAGRVFRESVIFGSVLSIAFWIVWLFTAWVILTQIFREDADWQQMLRTMGMAAMPLALSGLLFIPGVGFGIALASLALFFGLTNIAIQAVTPASTARVLLANLGGFTVWSVILGLLVTTDSYFAPGIFLYDVFT